MLVSHKGLEVGINYIFFVFTKTQIVRAITSLLSKVLFFLLGCLIDMSLCILFTPCCIDDRQRRRICLVCLPTTAEEPSKTSVESTSDNTWQTKDNKQQTKYNWQKRIDSVLKNIRQHQDLSGLSAGHRWGAFWINTRQHKRRNNTRNNRQKTAHSSIE